MNIAFDASDICTSRADGTTRYTRELLRRLPELGKNDEWNFYGPCANSNVFPDNGKWHATPAPFAWTQTRFLWELLIRTPDVLFMPIQQLPLLRWPKVKTVATIHDLAFHEYPEQFRYKDWALLHTFSAQVAREADAIIAVSEATKHDIEKYYGRTHNVHVIHHGIDHDRFRIFSEEEKQTGLQAIKAQYPAIQKKYILYVGQIQPRKNITRLVEAFEMMNNTDLQLVIAGGHGWNNKEIYERIEKSSRRMDIVVTGAVPDDLLPTLYANAEAFVLPSLQEGFGIPIIEAAACGTPVVTSNCSSTKEIMKGAGVLVDPLSSESIMHGIQQVLQEQEAVSKRCIARAQQFSWDTTAQQTYTILKEVNHI